MEDMALDTDSVMAMEGGDMLHLTVIPLPIRDSPALDFLDMPWQRLMSKTVLPRSGENKSDK